MHMMCLDPKTFSNVFTFITLLNVMGIVLRHVFIDSREFLRTKRQRKKDRKLELEHVFLLLQMESRFYRV